MKLIQVIDKMLVARTQTMSIQMFRYLIVGSIAFAIDFLLLFLLTNFFNLPVLVSAAISFFVGLVVNYHLSMIWIFSQNSSASKNRFSRDFLIFLVTGITGLGLNEICLYFFIEMLGINYMASKLITVPIVLMWNFFTRRTLLTWRPND